MSMSRLPPIENRATWRDHGSAAQLSLTAADGACCFIRKASTASPIACAPSPARHDAYDSRQTGSKGSTLV
eukprot:m.106006 g.106006  ORF g.106006 m.106006 type:complete len:71 (+) comp15295_c0_seq1:263-475(+)